MNNIQHTFYINLESRPDRRLSIENELERLDIKAERYNAVLHQKGYIGCGLSHIGCLDKALNSKNVLVLEDDLVWTLNRDELDKTLNHFFDTVKDWDVLILSGVVVNSDYITNGISKALDVQTTTAYLVNGHYIPVLKKNFETAVSNLEAGADKTLNSIDIFWKLLQRKDKWFVMTPLAGIQKDDYSDIEKTNVSYVQLFKRPFSVLLMGGLGNQLFQLAFGIALSKKQGTLFCLNRIYKSAHSSLDYSWFRRNIHTTNTSPKFSFNEPPNMSFSLMNIPNIPTGAFIEFSGYFQNEKYFKDYKDDIIKQFTPNVDEYLFNHKYPLLEKSYFIHIRRGDYVNNSNHFIDLSNYYSKCIDQNEHYYVFSDDINWCKENLDIKRCTFVQENEIDSLWLMSKCLKGGICANSSFSWWGSYLNTNKDKKVYFPSKWMNNNWNIDVYPDYAIIVDV